MTEYIGYIVAGEPEPRKMMIIPAGSFLTITTVKYSDYNVQGVFRAKSEINAEALRDEYLLINPLEKEDYQFKDDKFLAWCSAKGILEQIDSFEWHLCDYSSVSEMAVSDNDSEKLSLIHPENKLHIPSIHLLEIPHDVVTTYPMHFLPGERILEVIPDDPKVVTIDIADVNEHEQTLTFTPLVQSGTSGSMALYENGDMKRFWPILITEPSAVLALSQPEIGKP